MHAAHERITYEYLAKHGARRDSLQPLLVPSTRECQQKKKPITPNNTPTPFAPWVFELIKVAMVTTIRAVPSLLKASDAEALVRHVLADLITHGPQESHSTRHERNSRWRIRN